MPGFERGLPVYIEIQDRAYEIRFTLRVLKELQRDHGISVIRGAGDAMFDAEKLAIILWYGLREHQPELTLEWIEDNIDTSMLLGMMPSLVYAMTGREIPGAGDPNAARLSGTGSPSGPSGVTTLASVNGNSGS